MDNKEIRIAKNLIIASVVIWELVIIRKLSFSQIFSAERSIKTQYTIKVT